MANKIITVSTLSYFKTRLDEWKTLITNLLGSETLDTTSQTIKGAINEVNTKAKDLGTSKQDKLTAGDHISITNNVIETKNVPTLTDGKIPTTYLPSYVDDVEEYASQSAFPTTGETGKIYVAKDTNKTYRWGGSEYVEISSSLALGETASTAYYGDKGKIAYDHSQAAHARVDATAVSVSATGTATDEVQYITVDGTPYKLGGSAVSGVIPVDPTSTSDINIWITTQ